MVKYEVYYLGILIDTFDTLGEAEEYIRVSVEKWHINLFSIKEVKE